MTLWMEVDVKNKELPTGRMSTTAAELSRMCGREKSVVAASVRTAKLTGRPCKYVRVELEDEAPSIFKQSPCHNCSKDSRCEKTCREWEDWFKGCWRRLRVEFREIGRNGA